MLIILGYLVIGVCVFGGAVLSGAQLGSLYQPTEFLIIGGAGLGAFLAGNNGKAIRATLKVLPSLFSNSKYTKDRYMDLMALMYRLLVKARRQGMLALEADVDNPKESAIFNAYPRLSADKNMVEFITDYLRLMVSGNMDPFEIEALMNEEIETCEHEAEVPASSLHLMGDAFPAFGIVAAVMGVVNALSVADQPAAELGAAIAHAMVGTFLGILLAYGCVLPLASVLRQKSAEQIKMMHCIKVTLLSSLHGYAPQIAVEFGRKILYSSERPSFTELDTHMRNAKTPLTSDKPAN